MRTVLLSLALAGVLAGCGQEEPPLAHNPPPTVEETRQAEKSAEQGKPLSATSLTQIVRSALESESSLDARRIDVENKDGKITLRGEVDSEEQREKAGRIVGSVGGVTDVDNLLGVSPASSASTGASKIPELPK